MDTELVRRWWDYTLAYQDMLRGTDTPACPGTSYRPTTSAGPA